MDESRINNKWPLAKEGLPFVLISCALALIFLFLGLFFVFVLAAIISLFIIFFFRDPDRRNDVEQNAVLTPADGKILEVRLFRDNNTPLGEPAVKVSIFMSVFNVHVNRIPIGGDIEKTDYHPGRFFSANLDKASKYNENNRITLKTPDSHKIVFIQIAGLIARRIACWVKEGERVEAGQRFGLIRFGSRLEVYLPVDSRITVKLNQKVKAGKTIIGYIS
ncbi:MAG: phosphatidylserine decarboxylase [Desulfobacteraceae bacterium 4484_190.1]|nr:MAG: phosphatidylserine decarboxylase [Desulfobacteraceae bacterium 4484_190.1]